MAPIIGIDLGTTNSCIAYMEGNEPKVIPNLEGKMTTPTVVSFMDSGENIVGQSALLQATTNPTKAITAIKRLMGKKYNSAEVRKTQKRVPYRLIKSPNGDFLIEVDSRKISPQEISAIFLSYLKKCAESHFGEKVTEAVITVPAHFDDHQRQATKDAANIAGLDVLRIINEPTAASLAYGLQAKKNATVAVYDMGGGTFDITLLEINEGVFHVLATNGDTYLGGEDFDNRIVDWLIDEFKKEGGADLSSNVMALQRIKEASERAKQELSFTPETEIHLPFISSEGAESKHMIKILTREKLENLTSDLVKNSFSFIKQALKDSKLKPEDLDEIILVGGQTRMPLIKRLIGEFFNKEPSDQLNPEEVVAKGAAIQAGILKGSMTDMILLLDVTPLSLGIETENDAFIKIIEKNTTIPTRRTRAFTTVENDQRRVRIHVLQGEENKASENMSLAVFDLVGIEPAPAGVPQIDVTFEIDADGLAKVSARDMATGRQQQIEVRPSSGLSADQINKIIKKERQEGKDSQDS